MKQVAEGIKNLPINLQELVLNLSKCNIGKNENNVKYLREGINKLPYNLQSLVLDVSSNFLGYRERNLV